MTEKVYSRLARPRGVMDAMLQYVRLYGLKPIRRHRELARTFLNNITASCGECEGTGLIQSGGGVDLSDCPVCSGLGVVYTITHGELEAWRKVVLAAYPDAGITDWKPCTPYLQQEWSPEEIQEQLRTMFQVDKAMQEKWPFKEPPEKD